MPDEDETKINHDWLDDDDEGQLAVDVTQNDEELIIVAPIAGVKKSDLDIAINQEMVSIKGVRKSPVETNHDDDLLSECYWGPFSRNYILPVAINPDLAKANLKDGLLTIIIKKDLKALARKVDIKEE